MAYDDDARVADLLARLGDDGTRDLFRRLLERALQELIDAELSVAIGAGPHQRSEARTNHRNGGRDRLLSTPAGDVELRIPKVRVGSFFPSLLEPRRRVDKALWAVIMTAYTTGTSTRKVDELVRALGCDSGISRSTVSRICAEIDTEVEAFTTRRLDHIAFPYVYADATYIKARHVTASCHGPWWWPPGWAPTATGRCSACPWATARTRCSGPPSCARCGTGALAGCA